MRDVDCTDQQAIELNIILTSLTLNSVFWQWVLHPSKKIWSNAWFLNSPISHYWHWTGKKNNQKSQPPHLKTSTHLHESSRSLSWQMPIHAEEYLSKRYLNWWWYKTGLSPKRQNVFCGFLKMLSNWDAKNIATYTSIYLQKAKQTHTANHFVHSLKKDKWNIEGFFFSNKPPNKFLLQ